MIKKLYFEQSLELPKTLDLKSSEFRKFEIYLKFEMRSQYPNIYISQYPVPPQKRSLGNSGQKLRENLYKIFSDSVPLT